MNNDGFVYVNEEDNISNFNDELLNYANEINNINYKKKKKKHKKLDYTKGDNISTLVYLANSHKLKKSKNFFIKKFQKITIYIYDQSVLNKLLKEFGFKDVGSFYDYKEFTLPEDMKANSYSPLEYDLVNRIGISKKNKSLVIYNKEGWYINCIFLINIKKLKKFTEISSKIILDDSENYLEGIDLECEHGSYLEISDSIKDETKRYEIVRKKIPDENLVFDKNSTIFKVKKDILSFFTDKTKNIYKQLDLPYKRGIILYGEPGNGKSAMIREIIRTLDTDVIKITIRRVRSLVNILSALTNELNGKNAIVIMEDIDSLINNSNRSDLLNILDGIDVKSGLYLIGTTNYPEKIDPAFMNRAGRFDKSYNIGNPSKEVRRLFFESRNIDKLLKGYKLTKDNKGSKNEIISAFVNNSKDLPLASLKELITSVSYMLVYNEEKYIENAIKKVYKNMIESRQQHLQNHNMYNQQNMMNAQYGYNGAIIPNNTIIKTELIIDEKEVEKKRRIVHVKRIKNRD